MVLYHVCNLQIFKDEQISLIHECFRQFVKEIRSLSLDLPMDFRQFDTEPLPYSVSRVSLT